MNEYQEYLTKVEGYSFKLNYKAKPKSNLLSSEVLFHSPLIAFTILIITNKKKTIKSSSLPNLIGLILSNVFWGIDSYKRNMEWSLVLRKRYANALTFLELGGFLKIENNERELTLTEKAKFFIADCRKRTSRLGIFVRRAEELVSEVELKGYI